MVGARVLAGCAAALSLLSTGCSGPAEPTGLQVVADAVDGAELDRVPGGRGQTGSRVPNGRGSTLRDRLRGIPALAYARDGDVFMRALNGEESRLTSGAGIDGSPAWSADGSRIAFARWEGASNYFGSIYTLTVDGSNPVLHINGGVGPAHQIGGLGTPAWSPVSAQLAITRGDAIYDGEILLADENGRLSAPIAPMAAFPAWSPDGSRIAYVGLSGDDGYHTLHVMNANGAGKTELLPSDGAGLERPTWSPDGQQIAFSRCAHGNCQIWAIASDGSDLRQLTDVPSLGNATGPAWSPDGASIAFTLWDVVTWQPRVAIIPATGGAADILWEGHSPVWRPQRR